MTINKIKSFNDTCGNACAGIMKMSCVRGYCEIVMSYSTSVRSELSVINAMPVLMDEFEGS